VDRQVEVVALRVGEVRDVSGLDVRDGLGGGAEVFGGLGAEGFVDGGGGDLVLKPAG
jgi:hypothetical protein